MNEEIWKQIKEAPDCEISNFGNVRVKDRYIITLLGNTRFVPGHSISFNKKKTGYLEVPLPTEKGKRIYRLVHRLVLMTFNPVENMDQLEVNHKDENKENNKLENLEWVTSKENCNYGTRNQKVSNLKQKKVKCIETGIIYESLHKASLETGISVSCICNNCKGKTQFTRLNGKKYHWEYIND